MQIVVIVMGGLVVASIGHFIGENAALAVVGGWTLLAATGLK